MTAPMAIAVFFTIWWVALFAVLPFGVKSQHEAGGDTPMIGDPGAPVAPRLAIKALWTTGIALVLTGALHMWMTWSG